jgi:hypothetical protein
VGLTWSLDPDAQAALEEELFGKHVLITDHDDWPVPEYRSQSEAEFSFRQMKDTRVVSFSPVQHWTEHNIRVHVFTCVLALQIAHLMRRKAAQAWLRISVRELLHELAGISETVRSTEATAAGPEPTACSLKPARSRTNSPASSASPATPLEHLRCHVFDVRAECEGGVSPVPVPAAARASPARARPPARLPCRRAFSPQSPNVSRMNAAMASAWATCHEGEAKACAPGLRPAAGAGIGPVAAGRNDAGWRARSPARSALAMASEPLAGPAGGGGRWSW